MRKNKVWIISTFSILALVLAACAQALPQPSPLLSPTPPGSNPLTGTEWRLASFGPAGALQPVLPGSTITLRFEQNGQATGSGGCNSYGASYQVQGSNLAISQVISTEMACLQQGVMEQEQRYFQALQSTGSFVLGSDQLVISYNNGQGALNFVPNAVTVTVAPTAPATSTPTQPPSPTPQATETSIPPTETTRAPTSTPGQPAPTRIHFAAGATSATVTGHLPASGSDLYVLSAQAGQTMMVDLSFTQGRAILVIWGADGTVLMSDHAEASSFRGVLPSTQDYFIHIKGRPEGATDYSLQVTIPPVATSQPGPSAERIHFASGASSATVTGHLQASGSAEYVLSAQAGQTMTVDLSFTQGRAILAIWGADGNVLMTDHAQASYFSGTLPTTQDYYILLKGRPQGATDYSMQVTIPPLP